MPCVFIIILNYNSGNDVLECLESLEDISYGNHRILLVDNKSTDDSLKQVYFYAKQNDQPIEILELKQNYGYASGNNRGIKKALAKGADYVLILNPDTVVEKNFLGELVRVAEHWKNQGTFAFFGPRIYLNPKPSTLNPLRIYSNGGLINWTQTRGTLKDYGKTAHEVKESEPFETHYVTGTCLLASKETIEKVGLMREDYFLYYEDTDWAIRAKKEGIAQVIVPQSIIWHKVSTSTKAGSFSYIYYHTRNGLYCGWHNGNTIQRVAIIGISKWLFLKQFIKLAIPSKRVWAKAVMRGITDFWKGKTGKYDV